MTSRARRWRTALALVVTASSGCYWITPYEDLTEGRGDADAEADLDAAEDAASTDATIADAGRFCSTQDAYFCDDFDDGTLDAWGGPHVTPPDLLQVTSDALSAPSAARFAIPEDAGTTDLVYLEKSLGTAAGVDVAFDVHLDSAESGQDPTFLCRLAIGRWSTDLWVLPNLSNVVEVVDGKVLTHAVAWKPMFGPSTPWVHVTFSVALGADGGTSTLTDDEQTTTFTLDPAWKRDTARLRLGFIQVNAPSHGRVVRFDNVVVNVRSGT